MGHYGGSYKVTYDLYKKYGDMRVLDTPICGAAVLVGAPLCTLMALALVPLLPVYAQCREAKRSPSFSVSLHDRRKRFHGHGHWRCNDWTEADRGGHEHGIPAVGFQPGVCLILQPGKDRFILLSWHCTALYRTALQCIAQRSANACTLRLWLGTPCCMRLLP